ncbi:inorganic pyrophosphatase [Reticulomyxa filosa]|uniref:H(+)-exporting diphosphatase n=1 Tax=Reticulomyxa filosa TaxID=46433 RepID=X6MBL1_RETFI|nr:inorganic pyrophosphatase [Reticulomyxa filosa]|eukprot:ETO10415.1 inorganic pyrophosphatase [Reticulomyxa filosa]
MLSQFERAHVLVSFKIVNIKIKTGQANSFEMGKSFRFQSSLKTKETRMRKVAKTKTANLHYGDSTQAKKIWCVSPKKKELILQVYNAINKGAHAFLHEEYRFVSIFVGIFSLVILILLGAVDDWSDAAFTVIAFIVGAATSILSGYVGMKIGVFANARTAYRWIWYNRVKCQESLSEGFKTSVKAAIVMGFCLCGFGLFNLYILCIIYQYSYYSDAFSNGGKTSAMFEAIAGYGLGGSFIALFGRVGGGIYTKAADVGADLVGKVEKGIPEDDPRNPDLFGSFAEASCAALVIASQTNQVQDDVNGTLVSVSYIWQDWGYVSFPLVVSAVGILVCFLTSFLATHIFPADKAEKIESTLKQQLLVSTILMTPTLLGLCYLCLPSDPIYEGRYVTNNDLNYVKGKKAHNWSVFICLASGLWAGLAIGYITEYFTSNQNAPVHEVAEACRTGAATNIIMGLALGYKSAIIPVLALAFAAFLSHELAGYYGISMAALGILSTLSIGLTIDAFGPISDNAGGIAEMCNMGKETRELTDSLDAAGNTTAAIGKGFAIGSASFVSLALFSGFVTVIQNRNKHALPSVDILQAFPFAGLLVGAMIPYWFSAMTMKSVGKAAFAMVQEVRRQFHENPGIMEGTSDPDYEQCVRISTDASLKEMFAPGALILLTPLIVGFFFGVQALAGVLAGALVSGVQMAVSASNTGGAWDNAKKYIEKGLGELGGKGSEAHKAAVVGDTVGDPLKDTSGPSLNIVMKLMAIISLVFARAFPTSSGGLLGDLWRAIN